MKKIPARLCAGLLAACLLGTGTPTMAADAPAPAARFTLKDTFTGSIVGLDVVSAAIPFDKTWAELSPQQKEIVRADYESMPADDKPPCSRSTASSASWCPSRSAPRPPATSAR
jgi:hypothetical protein